MERKPLVFTRTGDDGSTSLVAGRRVAKHSLRVEVYGTVDELISVVGLARSPLLSIRRELDERLLQVQQELMVAAALLAADEPEQLERLPQLSSARVEQLEREIVTLTEELPPLTSFIIPGGSAASCALHHCRTVCRRLERRMYELHAVEPVSAEVRRYINRLSDWLFIQARAANAHAGQEDVKWLPPSGR